LAKGPSFWSANEASKDAQRAYDQAVKYDQSKPWKINKAARERDKAKEFLEKVERTGE
jgi:hypothetical protein